MERFDLVVIGAGISGLSLAFRAARSGRRVLVLEREARVGGCLRSERTADGFWFELGAHTTYNSYGALLDVIAGSGLADALVARGPARTTFGLLRDGEFRWLTPPKVLLQLGWLEAALHAPVGLLRSKRGHTLQSWFSGVVGPRNYQRILRPFLSAVPSQLADGFPAEGPGSLFKTRPRRKEFLRSFGLPGGLQQICEAAARTPGVEVRRGVEVRTLGPGGPGFQVYDVHGAQYEAPLLAVATPPGAAAALLADGFAEVARAVAQVALVQVDSLGVVLPAAKCWMPPCAFVVPADDTFFSCVTRDPFPDPERRAFAFHFRPGQSRAERLARACSLLRVGEGDLLHVAEQTWHLPAPGLGHAGRVEAIDRALAPLRLGLTGNYFAGLAIEDCVLRSNAEWDRIASPLARAA